MLRRLLDLIYAPLAALLLVLVLLLLCPFLILGPTLAIRREIGRAGVRLALLCIGVPIRVHGLSHLPVTPNVVVSNHASYLDGLVLTAALPRRYTFVVQHGAERWPLVGLTVRRMGVSFVNRQEARAGATQTRNLLRALTNGESLAVFAEGTFQAEPGVIGFKTGAFLIAARAGVPVVPAAIRGTRHIYGSGRRLPRWGTIDVHIDAPIAATGNDRPAAVQLRDAARARVLHLVGEPDLAHHRHSHGR